MNNENLSYGSGVNPPETQCVPDPRLHCLRCGNTGEHDRIAHNERIETGNLLISILSTENAGSSVHEDAAAKLKSLIAEL